MSNSRTNNLPLRKTSQAHARAFKMSKPTSNGIGRKAVGYHKKAQDNQEVMCIPSHHSC